MCHRRTKSCVVLPSHSQNVVHVLGIVVLVVCETKQRSGYCLVLQISVSVGLLSIVFVSFVSSTRKKMFRLVTKQTVRSVATSFKSANFATYKTSTGLVGLAVDPNGRENLNALANKVLSSIQVRCFPIPSFRDLL